MLKNHSVSAITATSGEVGPVNVELDVDTYTPPPCRLPRGFVDCFGKFRDIYTKECQECQINLQCGAVIVSIREAGLHPR